MDLQLTGKRHYFLVHFGFGAVVAELLAAERVHIFGKPTFGFITGTPLGLDGGAHPSF